MSTLYFDFETKSEVDIKLVGLANYVSHKSTQILMLAYAFDKREVQLWEPHKNPELPPELKQALPDPKIKKSAWHCPFERGIIKEKLGIWIDYQFWTDPQPSSRYLSLPGALEDVGEILGLPPELAKDKEGKRLIDVFSKPSKRKKKKGEEIQFYFRDWETDPEDWKLFCDYCKKDVVAEREIERRLGLLGVYPLPPREQKVWIVDARINERGLPVDLDFVQKAERLANRAKQEAIQKQNEITGLQNANSNSQLLAWVRERGFPGNSLRKEAVATAIADMTNELTPEAREVLKARKEASSTSYKKLSAILRQVSPDGRLRNQFIYLGSSRCGRWAGNSVQFQNLARPEKKFENKSAMDEVRSLIYKEDYETIKKKFDSVLLAIKSCIRTVFVAPPNKEIVVSDLNAIETRVAAWICECNSLLDVFYKGRDPYLDFCVKTTQIPYEILARDLKSEDEAIRNRVKEDRQKAKVGVLACVYQMGGGSWGKTKDGDPIKTGLWGYGANMQIEMSQEKAAEIVKVFRNSYPEIPKFWYAAEKAVADVLEEGTVRVKRELGPNGCIKIDKFIFNCSGQVKTILRVQLPSGRFLHYFDARLEQVKMPWKDENEQDVYRQTLVYAGQDQTTKQWTAVTSRGGKLLENWTQGIARDALADGIVETEKIGLPVVGHAHDEIIGEREKDEFAPGINDLIRTMSAPLSWAQNLPLGADGFESQFYKKN